MDEKEIIARLQAVRKQKRLSYQDIVDGTAAIGSPVSLSTIKRVFGADAALYDFRYDSTIRPIAAVVLDADEQPDHGGVVYAEISALKKIIDLKNERIAALEAQVTEKTAEIEKAHRAIQHKTRVEGVLAGIAGGLTVVLVVFYLAHAAMGW
jgi:hypothetical protein